GGYERAALKSAIAVAVVVSASTVGPDYRRPDASRAAHASRWRRGKDSNSRSPSRGCRLILKEEKGRRPIRWSRKTPSLFTGDQWFESGFLHRRVMLGSPSAITRTSRSWRFRCEADYTPSL